ncbi:MAG: hypothetical protein KVP17_000017 [Porospora cf. gigantea B]|uniref:uncharacterized protein n=1 Tax=Porospora cf. gigantea B TaxID=2853592 RepID=UPI003571B8C2|nr:MAG: hypothetical protein KVP17_000017 [Porospora cf. gigantea B]
MMEDRGYVVAGNEKVETFPDFEARLIQNDKQRSRMILIGSHCRDAEDKMICYFSDETKKTGVKPIRDLSEMMEERSIRRAVLVTHMPLTAFARDAVSTAAPRHIIECFLEQELLVNITKHELVPKHIPLSDEEKQNLLQRYKVAEVNLPRIQASDPVARYLGLSRGQVVKIVRPSETAGRYVTYRFVV